MQRKLLYTVDEAAVALGFSVRSVRYLIARGRLQTVREGRMVRIAATDLERYVERLRIDSRHP